VVLDMAPSWGDEGAVIVVTSPLLTRADVQSAFDQISEKYHVAGIDLRFDQQDEGPLQAIFEPSRARREFLNGEPIDETLKGSENSDSGPESELSRPTRGGGGGVTGYRYSTGWPQADLVT
jgi:hypothetical protein